MLSERLEMGRFLLALAQEFSAPRLVCPLTICYIVEVTKKSKQSKSSLLPSWSGLNVDPETQRGILSIILLATGLIITFSLFGFAGDIGDIITLVLTKLVGIGRYIVPLIIFVVVYTLLYPSDGEVQPLYFIGIGLLGLSLFGLVDVVSPNSGGYIGLAITWVFRTFASIAVAVVVLLALLLIAILILFNTSIDRLIQHIPAGTIIGKVLRFVVKLFSSARHRIAVAREQAIERVEEDYYTANSSEDSSDDSTVEFSQQFSHKAVGDAESDSESEELLDDDSNDKSDDEQEPGQMELIHLSTIHRTIDIPFNLLSNKRGKPTSGDIEHNKSVILKTLHNFGIDVEMGPVNVGPTVTQYTFKPASGVKVAQIVSLQNDIALALAAHPIRIEAPIPGKSLIGVEVPNVMAAQVGLHELLQSEEFKNRPSSLSLPFGRDVSGKAFIADLARMPHLLVAGATGSGKSVCINTILLSLLYQNGPDDLKLILVDPKRVEFSMYGDIPHLLTPVVTDVQKTINALRWCVNEMDRRYDVLSQAKKRDIAGYNVSNPNATMPFIVFVIDELADLMATAPREVEAAIVRLAQMARAVGIHLVLATQRPSVDVITGLIKANITARCAFNTASLVDSRTIIDTSGAEKLLGRGDMLFLNAETSKPRRLQGALVNEDEILRVVQYLKSKARADYDTEVVEAHAAGTNGSTTFVSESDNGSDELLPQAKDIIMKSQKASASLLQRRLRVGYARAARILDILEQQGFIGPAHGAKPREILVDMEELHEKNYDVNSDENYGSSTDEESTYDDENYDDSSIDSESIVEDDEDTSTDTK